MSDKDMREVYTETLIELAETNEQNLCSRSRSL